MSIALLNANGNSAAASGSPNHFTANVGSGWLVANQYLQITSQMSQSNGASIQTYTNNTAGTRESRNTRVSSAAQRRARPA